MDWQLAHPWAMLAGIPLLAHAVWMARRLGLLSRTRRAVALTLRIALYGALLLALAGLRITRHNDELTVLFVSDDSQSIFQPQRQYEQSYLRDKTGRMGARDSAGLIDFGADAALHQAPSRTPDFSDARTLVNPDRTDIGGALQLALACFPEGTQKRIVLLSDGNQNAGDAEDAARAAAAARVVIDVAPLHYENRNDAIVEKATVENRVSLDQPFDLRVIASAREAASGKLNVLQDGQLKGQFDVTLDAGKKSVFVVPTQVRDSGFHNFEVQLDVPGDQIPENNRAFAFTYAEGEPRVLLVDGDAQPSQALPAVLLAEKIKVDRIAPSSFPHDLGSLQAYDEIVFNNVPAADLMPDQLKMIESAVQDLGIGFIMIGGENSFGAGGYNDSPVEAALPVDMELKNEKILPQGALVPIIHTVEIPQGQYWSEQITLAALDVLSPRDLMGVLYYSWNGGEKWLFPLQEAGDKTMMRGLIQSMQPGDMPSFDRTLQMAYDALVACPASVRHIVVVSDGDPQTPNAALASKIQAAGITISTVCINPHTQRDRDALRALANLGGGNFYDVSSYNTLPQIFTREAAVVRKSLIFEEPFTPVEKQSAPELRGIAGGFPMLKGYVGTSPKSLADIPLVTDKGDPLLAIWRHGLGKSAAFTSDAKERWATQWLGWNQFAKFWSQLVRSCLRSPFDPSFQVQMNVDGAKGSIIVDAVNAGGDFINFLNIEGNVISPSMQRESVTLRQIAPGRYEATFDVKETGTYMLGASAAGEDGAARVVTGGTTVGYSPEFQASKSNESLLYRLAEITGGRVLDAEAPVFLHNLPSQAGASPLWQGLVLAALPLLLADIFARRVLVGWGAAAAGVSIAWAWAAGRLRRKEPEADRETSELLEAKQRARALRPEQEAGREQLLERLQQADADAEIASEAGGRHAAKPIPPAAAPKEAPKPEAPPASEFTSQLLKAREQTRRRFDKNKDKNKDQDR